MDFVAFFFLTQCLDGVAFGSIWWRIYLSENCTDGSADLVVNPNIGVCPVHGSRLLGSTECIEWSDKEQWIDIDNIAKSNTWRAARVIFPGIQQFRLTAGSICTIQIGLCLVHLYHKRYSVELQLLIGLLGLAYQTAAFSLIIEGNENDICKPHVWQAISGCRNGQAESGEAYWLVGFAALTSLFGLGLTIFPQYVSFLQLVDYKSEDFGQDSVSLAQSHDSKWYVGNQNIENLARATTPQIVYSIETARVTEEGNK